MSEQNPSPQFIKDSLVILKLKYPPRCPASQKPYNPQFNGWDCA